LLPAGRNELKLSIDSEIRSEMAPSALVASAGQVESREYGTQAVDAAHWTAVQARRHCCNYSRDSARGVKPTGGSTPRASPAREAGVPCMPWTRPRDSRRAAGVGRPARTRRDRRALHPGRGQNGTTLAWTPSTLGNLSPLAAQVADHFGEFVTLGMSAMLPTRLVICPRRSSGTPGLSWLPRE
jgi:hypothetical protein